MSDLRVTACLSNENDIIAYSIMYLLNLIRDYCSKIIYYFIIMLLQFYNFFLPFLICL